MPPIVSLILPTRNDLTYLETTLQSVAAQTQNRYELIIVDDGSDDETPLRLRALTAADARLRYVRREQAGIGAARNAGIALAQGRYLGFVDADDLLHPAFLHTLVNALENSKADVAQCQMQCFEDGGTCKFPPCYSVAMRTLSGANALQALLTGEIAPGVCSRLYRRDTLGSLRFAPDLFYEDVEYSARMFALAGKVQVVPLPLYGYRQRAGAVRARYTPRLVKDRMRVTRQVRDTLRQAGALPGLESEFRQLAARFLGFEGMGDLMRAEQFDDVLFLQLIACLRGDGDLSYRIIRRLPIAAELKKRVGAALISPRLGRWLLALQKRRLANA
jgi:glycosyltransferase involved in cell wall biosynthesis